MKEEIRLKVLDTMDGLAMFSILILASGADTAEPMVVLRALLIPAIWLLARYFANH